MGLGFTIALTCIGAVREILGSGGVFGFTFIPEDFRISIFVLAPGAFFVLSILQALQNKFKAPSATNGSVKRSELVCGGDCLHCQGSACSANHALIAEKVAEEAARKAAEKKAAAEKAAAAKKAAAEKAAQEQKAETPAAEAKKEADASKTE